MTRGWILLLMATVFLGIVSTRLYAGLPPITFEEEDGSPSKVQPIKVKIANGNLTDNGDGTVSIADQTGAGGGDPILVNTTAITDAAGVDLTTGTAVSVTLNAAVSPDTATFDVVDDSIGATELADADFGDFTCADAGGGCTLDGGVVAAAEMADADHGDVSWTTSVATVENVQCTDCVALTTETSGNYTATIADAGNTTITVTNGTAEGGAVTLDAIDLNCTDCIGTTEIADSYVLNTNDTMTTDDATASGVTDILTLEHTTSGAAAAGIGTGLVFNVEDAGGSEEQGSIDVILDDVTDTTEDATMTFNINQNGAITKVLSIDGTNGYVGINTTTVEPTSLLTIGSGSNDDRYIFMASGGLNARGIKLGRSPSGTETPDATIETDASEDLILRYNQQDLAGGLLTVTRGSTNADVLDMDTNGNIGIGTQSQTARLHIADDGTANNYVLRTITDDGNVKNMILQNTVSGTADTAGLEIYVNNTGHGILNVSTTSDDLLFQTQGTTRASVLNTGNFDITGTFITDVGFDGDGAIDLDYGSADITDHAFTTDGGVVTLDGSIDSSAGNLTLNDGVIFLKEQAEADADVAGYGQIWVDLATPNVLYFTDDAGTDHNLTASGSGDITDVFNCASGDCSALTAGAADTLDMSSSSSSKPFDHATDCSGVTAEGSACWDTDNDNLYVGDGAAAKQMNGGGSDTNSVKTIIIPMSASLPLEAADSIPPINKDVGTNVDHLVISFDDSADECRQVDFVVPTDVQSGSTITFGLLWYSQTATSGNVIWDFRHTSGDTEGESWDSALTTEAAAADATQGTVDLLTRTEWTETLANLGWAADDVVSGLVCRDADNASDTLVGDAEGLIFYAEIPRA